MSDGTEQPRGIQIKLAAMLNERLGIADNVSSAASISSAASGATTLVGFVDALADLDPARRDLLHDHIEHFSVERPEIASILLAIVQLAGMTSLRLRVSFRDDPPDVVITLREPGAIDMSIRGIEPYEDLPDS